MKFDDGKNFWPGRGETRENFSSINWAGPATLLGTLAFVLSGLLFQRLLPMFPDQSVVLLWLGMLPMHGFATLTAAAAAFWYLPGGRRATALGLQYRDLVALGRGVSRKTMFVVIVYMVAMGINAIMILVMFLLGLQAEVMPLLEVLMRNPSPGLIVSVGLAALVIAPISEEFIFRTVLFEALRPIGIKYATFFVALCFALAHGSVTHLPALFFLGLVLQWLRLRTGSLWPCIFCHILFNALTLVPLGLWLAFA